MRRKKTAFDLDVQKDMRNPEYRAAYLKARARIDAVDNLVRAIDAAREAQNLSKAELARRMGVQPESVRRLFSVSQPNPTVRTLVAAAEVVGLRLEPVPVSKREGPRLRRQPAYA